MCGIVGALGGNKADVESALTLIKRRGPDASSVLDLGKIVFGHNRLSIIDLAETANQPMHSSCGRYIIVFNGEIYNYQEIRRSLESDYNFKTNSDTETILAAYKKWGRDCVHQFKGMFAFAIWDTNEQKIFGARDRLGVKPFYYHHKNNKFVFASRPDAVIKAAGLSEVSLNRQAVRLYLEAGYVPAPYSIYNEVQKLPPGCSFEFQNGIVKIEKYWALDKIKADPSVLNKSEKQLLQELDELVTDSVRLRMVSDVPVGVFLSGGIDSSLVAAIMAKLANGPVKSFSIGFSDSNFDESVHAQAVADHLKTQHNLKRFHPDDLLGFMPDFISQYDEPFFDYSAFPVMGVSSMARTQVKVSLSGDGGDEAFGGYHYYQIMQKYEKLLFLPGILRKFLSFILSFIPSHKIRLLSGLLSCHNLASAFAFLRGVIKNNSSVLSDDLKKSTFGLKEVFEKRMSELPDGISAAEVGMRLDISYTLPDDYLQKVDVGSMAFSLEARDPLLDYRIFEWAAKLPVELKLAGTNKYLLRKLAYQYIPQEILDRPKMGFGVPMAEWLRGPLKSWAEKYLADEQTMKFLGLVPDEVKLLWNKHLNNEVQAHTTLWSILVLMAFKSERAWLK